MNSDARAKRREQYLMSTFNLATRHLTSYGEGLVSAGRGRRRRRWSQQLTKQATELLRCYFFASSWCEIREAESGLEPRVILEVRLRFANSCIQRKVVDTPGQRQQWYDALAHKAKAFLIACDAGQIQT